MGAVGRRQDVASEAAQASGLAPRSPLSFRPRPRPHQLPQTPTFHPAGAVRGLSEVERLDHGRPVRCLRGGGLCAGVGGGWLTTSEVPGRAE